MKTFRFMLLLFLSIFMVACQKEIPKPETKNLSFYPYEAILASAKKLDEVDPFFISHQVKGNDVYVECRIRDISFRNDLAILILTINGKKMNEINHPAFVIKGLQKGTHKIKLEIMKKNENITSATREFNVTIP